MEQVAQDTHVQMGEGINLEGEAFTDYILSVIASQAVVLALRD